MKTRNGQRTSSFLRYAFSVCLALPIAYWLTQPATAGADEWDSVPDWLEEEAGYDDDDDSDDSSAYLVDETADAAYQTADSATCPDRCDCLWCRKALFGDCFGHRSCWQQKGITFQGRVSQFGLGVAGGVTGPVPPPFRPGNSFEYTGGGKYDFLVDLEKFGGPTGGKFLFTLEHSPWGRFANVWFNSGALAPPALAPVLAPVKDEQGVPYVSNFVFTQPLSENLIVAIGKKRMVGLYSQDIFAGGDGTEQFLAQPFNGNPALGLTLPFSSMFATAILRNDRYTFSLFAVDAQDRTDQFFSRLGDLFSEGICVGSELRARTNFFCRPGQHHIGGVWKHTDQPDLRGTPPPPDYPYPPYVEPSVATLPNAYTIYYGFDQAFRVYSPETRQAWGVFGRFSISDGNPTTNRYFVSLGIGGYSPFAWERRDRFGIGWFYSKTPSSWGPVPRAAFDPQDETGVEMYYNFQVTPWLNITPDVQYMRPELSALTSGQDVFVYGLRVIMRL